MLQKSLSLLDFVLILYWLTFLRERRLKNYTCGSYYHFAVLKGIVQHCSCICIAVHVELSLPK